MFGPNEIATSLSPLRVRKSHGRRAVKTVNLEDGEEYYGALF